MKLAGRLVSLLVVLGLAGFYAWLGSVPIGPDERAVVLRLGHFVRTLEPGLRFYAPGLERIERQPMTIQREEFGYRTQEPAPPAAGEQKAPATTYDPNPEERRMLTGDANLVDAEFVVQWQIRDLGAFQFNVEGPRELIRDTSQAVVRAVVGMRPIDDVLVAAKQQIESQATQRIQALLDGYGMGVHIRSVQLQEVKPPDKVADAFRDLESARQDRERLILEAQGYRDQILPRTLGEAQELVAQAEAYKAAKILDAQGDASRFNALLTEYKKAPAVTRERLYLETLEKILPRMDKVILQGEGGQRMLPYLPLERRPK